MLLALLLAPLWLPPAPAPAVCFGFETSFRPARFAASRLSADVRMFEQEKSLVVSWSFDGPDGKRVFLSERFGAARTPTAASRFDDGPEGGDSILVAVVDESSGAILIERWDFELAALPRRGVTTKLHVRTVFESDVEGRRRIQRLAPVESLPDSVFVHFQDSGDLYVLSATTGELTLSQTAEQAPELAREELRFFWGGQVVSGAYVYIYQPDYCTSRGDFLHLTDRNGDGVIDETRALPLEEWNVVAALPWAKKG